MHCNGDEFTASPLVKVERMPTKWTGAGSGPLSSSGTPSVPILGVQGGGKPPAVCKANSSGEGACVSDSATLWTVARQALSVRGILQAKILAWVAMPCFRGSSQPRDQT